MSDSENQTNQTPDDEAREVEVNVFGRTDVGLVRDHNEDNFLIADLTRGNRSIKPEVRTHTVGDRGSLFVVCDGMGGAAAGEVASRIGVDTICEMMQVSEPPADDRELARRLEGAIREAGTRIYTAARLNRGQRGMGTTATAAVLVGDRLVIGQVGDSRAYVIRGGEMVQVTKDQSLVQQLIDANQLTEEEAKNFERSNIILQALGTNEEVHVDVTSVELKRGDTLVMCSDGLSGLVEPEPIRDAVLENEDPMEACRRLTEMACEKGGDDNITVVVARFGGEGLAEPTSGDVLAYEKYDYPKAGEVTARTPMPRPPEEDEQAEKQPERVGSPAEEKAAAGASKADDAEPKTAAGSERAAERKAEDDEGARAERERSGGKGRSVAIVVVLVLIAGAGLAAAYLSGALDGGGSDGEVRDLSSEPTASGPAAEDEPAAGDEQGSEGDRDAPHLSPVDAELLTPDGETKPEPEPEPELEPEPEPEPESAGGVEASDGEELPPETPAAKKEGSERPAETSTQKASEPEADEKKAKKKKGKKKNESQQTGQGAGKKPGGKKDSEVPDNPYG
ncbi:MAG: Stp1/IreP family PP2C-type Ser/Thr phosphatase [Polyangia bacterium]